MTITNTLVIGWREWVKLPDLKIPRVKAKVDTGARSSSLHAFDIHTFDRDGVTFVSFKVHPLQRNAKKTIECQSEVLEFRNVRSSSGHSAKRPVIRTSVRAAGQIWTIDLTLANRDAMGFRMLLGREAFRGRFLVDAGNSWYGGKPKRVKKAAKDSTVPRKDN
jgi:hypothetical protein